MDLILDAKIQKIKKMSMDELCERFNCTPEQICMGDYIAKHTSDTVCPYKVILGYANFEDSDVTSLGDLQLVLGKRLCDQAGIITDVDAHPIYLGINLKNSRIADMGNLKIVYGSITFNKRITSLGNLEFIGSNLYLNNTNIEDFGNLQYVHGTLCLEELKHKIISFQKIKKIGTLIIDVNSIEDIGDLEEINKILFGKNCHHKTIAKLKQFVPKPELEIEQ